MKDILAEIVAHIVKEVAERSRHRTVEELERSAMFNRDASSLRSFLKQPHRTGIIAEFKRKSPSKGVINDTASVQEVTTAYARNGASGLSVLTDQQFFGGSMDDAISPVGSKPMARSFF